MPRHQIELTLAVRDGSGRTLNVSSRGVYFETSERLAPGDTVLIVFPFERTAPGACVRCSASVVRVDWRGDLFGVAATYEPVGFSVPV